ncbi:phage holin family protein [Peribacillus kribbensis]|uniref:phage holin family protein n=1 Tax=Peribacillus kribbensis TaxID=356658 RepID=UPI000684A968|nr:phage holin family protein [Peribacillus kribbensis]
MRKIKIPTITAILGTPIAFLFGDFTPFMMALLVLSALDILTGIAKGFYNKELRSRKMSQGMIRKSMIFVVIIIANMTDIALFHSAPVAKTGAVFYYIGMEGLSILENLDAMNVSVPGFIKKYLQSLKDKGENSENKKGD